MQQYLSILIFVVPGFFMRMIHDKLVTKEKIKSDFEKTIISLIYGIPIMAFQYLILEVFYGITTVTDAINKFNSLFFIFKFSLLTIIMTLILSVIWSFISPRYTVKLINFIRKINSYNEISTKPTTWDEFMNANGKNKAISIWQDDKMIAKGFIKNWNLNPEDDKELSLEFEDIMDEHPECFDKIDNIYYNLSKNIIIKEYNLDKLYSKQEKLNSPTS